MMRNASEVSPFSMHQEDAPWFLWQKKTPVTYLAPREETDSRSENSGVNEIEQANTPPVQPMLPAIQRKQYNAVMNRIDQASRMTGTYAQWNT